MNKNILVKFSIKQPQQQITAHTNLPPENRDKGEISYNKSAVQIVQTIVLITNFLLVANKRKKNTKYVHKYT